MKWRRHLHDDENVYRAGDGSWVAEIEVPCWWPEREFGRRMIRVGQFQTYKEAILALNKARR